MEDILKDIVARLEESTTICNKAVLTSSEASKYLGISKSHLYKLTMRREIPHYKPMGKCCYFNREELERWVQSNRIATGDEIKQQAQNYCTRKGGEDIETT